MILIKYPRCWRVLSGFLLLMLLFHTILHSLLLHSASTVASIDKAGWCVMIYPYCYSYWFGIKQQVHPYPTPTALPWLLLLSLALITTALAKAESIETTSCIKGVEITFYWVFRFAHPLVDFTIDINLKISLPVGLTLSIGPTKLGQHTHGWMAYIYAYEFCVLKCAGNFSTNS